MEHKKLSAEVISQIKKAQMDEEYGAELYSFIAKREKNQVNKEFLLQLARDERKHAAVNLLCNRVTCEAAPWN